MGGRVGAPPGGSRGRRVGPWGRAAAAKFSVGAMPGAIRQVANLRGKKNLKTLIEVADEHTDGKFEAIQDVKRKMFETKGNEMMVQQS